MKAQNAIRYRLLRCFGRVLLLLIPTFCTGCLEFEKQTVLVGFLPDKDEVRALFIYEGLRVGDSHQNKNEQKRRAANLKKASDDLSALVRGERFYLGHPLWMVPMTLGENPSEKERQIVDLLKKHLIIGKGFFIPQAGSRFTYCQDFVVREPGKLVAGLNLMISDAFAGMEKQEDSIWDAKTFEMVQKAGREKVAWLKLEPGRLSFTMPATPHSVARFKREFLQDRLAVLSKLIDGLLEKPENTKMITAQLKSELENLQQSLGALAENPLSLDVRAGQVTLAVGYGNGEPMRLQTLILSRAQPAGKLEADLLTHARTLGIPIRQGIDVKTVVLEFENSYRSK